MYDKAAKVFLFRSQWFPTNPCGLLFLARSSCCFLFKDALFLRLHFVCPLLTNCELALPFCFLAALAILWLCDDVFIFLSVVEIDCCA